MRGVTRLIPTKNNVSNANKEKDKHSKILDGSFFRRLLKRFEIHSFIDKTFM